MTSTPQTPSKEKVERQSLGADFRAFSHDSSAIVKIVRAFCKDVFEVVKNLIVVSSIMAAAMTFHIYWLYVLGVVLQAILLAYVCVVLLNFKYYLPSSIGLRLVISVVVVSTYAWLVMTSIIVLSHIFVAVLAKA